MNNDFDRIPNDFASHMSELLGDEYKELEAALIGDRSFGLRINPIKFDIQDVERIKGELGIPNVIKWCDEGFYYAENSRPGKSPLHEAGAIYIQEPSAMAVVRALDPKPGERILDLCAAPGGKSTHIAGKLGGQGLLVANEIVPDRARILSRNIERMGIGNCLVTNEDPDGMMNRFSGFFHRVVVDAPCSGEGMFRKEDAAVTEWSLDNVRMCAERQRYILDRAEKMVMPGGTLVYSTCTFEPAEDEEVIGDFLKTHPDWGIVATGLDNVLDCGRPEWMDDPNPELYKTTRIWPHKHQGEGHYIAKLVRKGEYPVKPEFGSDNDNMTEFGFCCSLFNENVEISDNKTNKKNNKKRSNNGSNKGNGKGYSKGNSKDKTTVNINVEQETIRFINGLLEECFLADRINRDELIRYSDSIYLLPSGISSNMLRGLKVIRPGLCLVDICKDRLEPSHSLAMAVALDCNTVSRYDMSIDDAYKYMRGETLSVSLENIPGGSWVLMTVMGVSIGWGKYVNGIIKNHYPKGLRRM